MATHQSAIKRNRQNQVRRLRNRTVKSRLRTRIKRVLEAIHAKDYDEAQRAIRQTIPVVDNAASRGVIHRRNAARKISRLTRKVNALGVQK